MHTKFHEEIHAIADIARRSLEPGMPDLHGQAQSTGMCLHGSMLLMVLLRQFAIPDCFIEIRGGEFGIRDLSGVWRGHYWVEASLAEERYVIDITADQFGYDRVVVLPIEVAQQMYRPGPQDEVNDALISLAEDFGCAELLGLTRPRVGQSINQCH
jgi:hypothetical protein